MALRLLLAKRWLSDPNQISKCSFSLSAIRRKDDALITEDSILDAPKLPHVEERKLDHDLIDEHPFIVHEISGIPEEHLKERLVRISKATKNAMQSGTHNTDSWIIRFDNRQRWENNLMGWISSGDPLSNLELRFKTKEQAISYCDKFSYAYFIENEKPMLLKKKSYAENFSWNKRTRTSTK